MNRQYKVKSYTFKAVIEEDTFPDGTIGYFASVPELEHLGAATQGMAPEEALRNLQEVVQMIIKELTEERKSIPDGALLTSDEPLVTVSV